MWGACQWWSWLTMDWDPAAVPLTDQQRTSDSSLPHTLEPKWPSTCLSVCLPVSRQRPKWTTVRTAVSWQTQMTRSFTQLRVMTFFNPAPSLYPHPPLEPSPRPLLWLAGGVLLLGNILKDRPWVKLHPRSSSLSCDWLKQTAAALIPPLPLLFLVCHRARPLTSKLFFMFFLSSLWKYINKNM